MIRNVKRVLVDRAVVSSLYGGFYPTLDELRFANRQSVPSRSGIRASSWDTAA